MLSPTARSFDGNLGGVVVTGTIPTKFGDFFRCSSRQSILHCTADRSNLLKLHGPASN